jgi:hypothetical protein
MTRYAPLATLLALLLATPGGPLRAENPHPCAAAVAAMRVRAAELPAGDLSRRFAETELASAMAELEAGDPDECEEMVERAGHIVETRPYALRPGEMLHGYGPDGPLQAAAAPPR